MCYKHSIPASAFSSTTPSPDGLAIELPISRTTSTERSLPTCQQVTVAVAEAPFPTLHETAISSKPAVPLRRKLWELDSSYLCSVIGTCLTLGELRHILKKLKLPTAGLRTDYELHRVFVAGAQTASPATRWVNKYLDRKYRNAIQQLGKTPTAEAFRAYWQAARANGEVAGAYWAVLTHPHTPSALVDDMYGEIHMLSHLSGASVRVDMQELHHLKYRCEALTKQLADVQNASYQRLQDQQKIIETLKRQVQAAADTERQLVVAQTQIAELKTQVWTHAQTTAARQQTVLQTQLERAYAAVRDEQHRAAQIDEYYQQVKCQLAALQEEHMQLEAALARLLTPPCVEQTAESANDMALGLDLRGQCVLYVGGRAGQCAHFREWVERCQGRFIYHDGGREDAPAHLHESVQQADVILCPLDCVSHDAVHRIKRLCARYPTRLVLLPRSSLAAFTRGLNTAFSPLADETLGDSQ